jgi:uncharacterized integral membrane protein
VIPEGISLKVEEIGMDDSTVDHGAVPTVIPSEGGTDPLQTDVPNSSHQPPVEQRRAPTRISASWTAVVVAVFLLIALIIFIAQNTQSSSINFLGVHGRAPTAVVLLIAATTGAVVVIIAGVARILQLRRSMKGGDRHSDGH